MSAGFDFFWVNNLAVDHMLSETTYGKIKNMIYAGRLKPGQRLVERDLSRIFAVSRVPLRECLIRLESRHKPRLKDLERVEKARRARHPSSFRA